MVQSRLLRTVLLVGILLHALMLWFTRSVDLESQSAYANADNLLWYNGMHVTAIMFFILHAGITRKILPFFIGVGMGTILMTNMYHYMVAHQICTGLTILLAYYYIVMGASKKNRPLNVMLAVLGSGMFLLSLLTPYMKIFWGEVIAELTVAVAMARRIWIDDEA